MFPTSLCVHRSPNDRTYVWSKGTAGSCCSGITGCHPDDGAANCHHLLNDLVMLGDKMRRIRDSGFHRSRRGVINPADDREQPGRGRSGHSRSPDHPLHRYGCPEITLRDVESHAAKPGLCA
jgi:hypothetical protein